MHKVCILILTDDIATALKHLSHILLLFLNTLYPHRHYSVLHQNVVAMAQALDNYPTSVKDPYEAVRLFPDDVIRKDVLDELQPPGQTNLPRAPPAPACPKCVSLKVFY